MGYYLFVQIGSPSIPSLQGAGAIRTEVVQVVRAHLARSCGRQCPPPISFFPPGSLSQFGDGPVSHMTSSVVQVQPFDIGCTTSCIAPSAHPRH